MKTILLSGKRGTGKDTAGQIIKEIIEDGREKLVNHVELKSFAEPMKKFLVDTFNFNPIFMYGETNKRNEDSPIKWEEVVAAKRLESESGYMTYRDILKLIGQGMREQMPNIWAVAARNSSEELIKKNILPVFMDTRMKNEVLEFGGRCLNIRMFRRTPWAGDTHETETQLDSWDFYPYQTSFNDVQLNDYLEREYLNLIWDNRESSHVNYFIDNNYTRSELYHAIHTILKREQYI